MAWVAEVVKVVHLAEQMDMVHVFFSCHSPYPHPRQVLEPRGTYVIGNRLIYVENGKFRADSPVLWLRGRVVGEEGVLVPWRLDLPWNGTDMSAEIGFQWS